MGRVNRQGGIIHDTGGVKCMGSCVLHVSMQCHLIHCTITVHVYALAPGSWRHSYSVLLLCAARSTLAPPFSVLSELRAIALRGEQLPSPPPLTDSQQVRGKGCVSFCLYGYTGLCKGVS